MGILGWCLMVAGLLAGLVSVATIVGCFLPRGHMATRTLALKQPPEAVWTVLRTGEDYPKWWSIVKTVERQPGADGRELWRLDYMDGNRFVLEVAEAASPSRLVMRIDDVNKLFSGQWDYALEPADGGSRVTLTERGEVANPLIRLMARLMMDPHMYIDVHLKALAAKFGETPVLH
jgi:uncharacterized protein YndB with AHSA1/START domain